MLGLREESSWLNSKGWGISSKYVFRWMLSIINSWGRCMLLVVGIGCCRLVSMEIGSLCSINCWCNVGILLCILRICLTRRLRSTLLSIEAGIQSRTGNTQRDMKHNWIHSIRCITYMDLHSSCRHWKQHSQCTSTQWFRRCQKDRKQYICLWTISYNSGTECTSKLRYRKDSWVHKVYIIGSLTRDKYLQGMSRDIYLWTYCKERYIYSNRWSWNSPGNLARMTNTENHLKRHSWDTGQSRNTAGICPQLRTTQSQRHMQNINTNSCMPNTGRHIACILANRHPNSNQWDIDWHMHSTIWRTDLDMTCSSLCVSMKNMVLCSQHKWGLDGRCFRGTVGSRRLCIDSCLFCISCRMLSCRSRGRVVYIFCRSYPLDPQSTNQDIPSNIYP